MNNNDSPLNIAREESWKHFLAKEKLFFFLATKKTRESTFLCLQTLHKYLYIYLPASNNHYIKQNLIRE